MGNISSQYVDGLELRIKELEAQLVELQLENERFMTGDFNGCLTPLGAKTLESQLSECKAAAILAKQAAEDESKAVSDWYYRKLTDCQKERDVLRDTIAMYESWMKRKPGRSWGTVWNDICHEYPYLAATKEVKGE